MITELLRKTTHLSGLFIPLLYITLDKPQMLIIVGCLTGTALVIEFLKWVSEGFRNLFFRYFKSILRTHEQKGALTGATFYILSTFLCILFFKKRIAIVCILFVVLGDAVAALVGIKWGRIKLIGKKSLEGSAACFLVCTSISLIWLNPNVGINPIVGITGAFVATVVELLPLRIDDNLTVSIISGVVMHLMMIYLPL